MDRQQLEKDMATLTNEEVVAYWNVSQMGQKTIQTNPEINKTISEVASKELTKRGIPHQQGKLINKN